MTRNYKGARRMLTTEEAAAYLGTTARHVRRLVTDHELSRYKVGGRNRFADVDLDAWLDARRVEGRTHRRSASRVGGR
jgi:excisionase family DNA binding protein